MDPLSLVIGSTNVGVGLLLVALLLPLLYEKIPRNPWYGFRFPSSMTDDATWYDVNRYGARQMIYWSLGLIVLGIVALFLPLSANPTAAVVGGSASLVLLIPAVQSWLYSRKRSMQ